MAKVKEIMPMAVDLAAGLSFVSERLEGRKAGKCRMYTVEVTPTGFDEVWDPVERKAWKRILKRLPHKVTWPRGKETALPRIIIKRSCPFKDYDEADQAIEALMGEVRDAYRAENNWTDDDDRIYMTLEEHEAHEFMPEARRSEFKFRSATPR